MQAVPQSSVDKTVPSACLGCRLRRRKCGREKPICLNCVDLKVPPNMCLYRSVGLISKDSKSTLQAIKEQNENLKNQLKQLELKRKASSEEAESRTNDYKLRKRSDSITSCYKHLQLNPQKNPLLNYIKETNLGLTHYGSFSIDALTNNEPSLKLLINQIDTFMKRERLKYDTKRKKFDNGVENDESINNVKAKILEKRLGLSKDDGDNDFEILELIIKGVEKILPDSDALEMLLTPYFRHNRDRCVAFVYFDEESVRESIKTFLDVSSKRPKININLPQEVDKLPGLLQFVSILIFPAFIVSVTIRSKLGDYNYLLYLEYAEAMLNTKPFTTDLKFILNLETMGALAHIITFEVYTPNGRVMNDNDGAKSQIIAKRLTRLGELLNLHKDIDVEYAHENPSIRRSLKSLWYFIVHIENAGSFEGGSPTRINSNIVKVYPDFSNELTAVSLKVNDLLRTYHKIEMMEDTYALVEILEAKCIKVLKKTLAKEFGPLQNDVDHLQNFNYDDPSLVNEFRQLIQRLIVRIFTLTILQTFHYICFKRLEQIGDRSPQYERYKILTWKYSLLFPVLMAEIMKGFKKLSNHPNHGYFHVVSSLLHLAHDMRMADRNMGIYASARILDTLKIDNSVLIKRLLVYRSKNNKDREIHEILKERGEYQHCYTISDFDNFQIDDDFEALRSKFSRFQDVKYIIVNFSRKMVELLDLLVNNKYNLNYMKLNYGFFLMLRMSSLFLNIVFPYEKLSNKLVKEDSSPSEEEFDFNELFKTSIDTTSNKTNFESFFTAGYGDIYQVDDIEEFFGNFHYE